MVNKCIHMYFREKGLSGCLIKDGLAGGVRVVRTRHYAFSLADSSLLRSLIGLLRLLGVVSV